MCGIVAYLGTGAAAPIVYSGLTFLQHRGQDAAGIATMSLSRLLIEKGGGLVRDVFDGAKINTLEGAAGIGHVRYSTSGSALATSEMQPFYVNQPYGITLAHNGNLVNRSSLCAYLSQEARHINTVSDSEALLNVLAQAIYERVRAGSAYPDALLDAVGDVHERCAGAYAVVALIAGVGLLLFRDPLGIRPLSLGTRADNEWLAVSESAAFRPLGFDFYDDIAPGEAVFIDTARQLHRRSHRAAEIPRPCIFEYIYFARPDSVLNGALVYDARVNMGRYLAEKIRRQHPSLTIDCVIPVPDSGRVAALEVSRHLQVPYREGLVKNHHVGRTFIAADSANRHRSVSEKLNIIAPEFSGKRVLLVDDSIVRGTTGSELVSLARTAGAKQVFFASAAPPVRYPNVFGIDIATRGELLANGRTETEIAAHLGADCVIYQDMDDLKKAISDAGVGTPAAFETSCFDGEYPISAVDNNYLKTLEAQRGAGRDRILQLDLPLKSKIS